MTYAVRWNENEGFAYAGKLELTRCDVHLVGTGGGVTTISRDVRYEDLDQVYLERCPQARSVGEPALVLTTFAGDRIAIGSLEGLGALHELAETVAQERDRADV
jgi:hypothetical protein